MRYVSVKRQISASHARGLVKKGYFIAASAKGRASYNEKDKGNNK